MEMKYFPGINLEATGKHIAELRVKRGLTVKDLQDYFGFGAPQAIYKWQNGASLPTVDNLLALSMILEVPMESILVTGDQSITPQTTDEPAGSVFFYKKSRGSSVFPAKRNSPKQFHTCCPGQFQHSPALCLRAGKTAPHILPTPF